MDNANYAISVFKSHVEKFCKLNELAGKVIVEVGPGDSVATAIIAASYGARAILVDVGSFAKPDMTFYLKLTEKLSEDKLSSPDLSECRSVQDILVKCNALYLTSGTHSLSQIETDSVDLMFSQAVLEHVRKAEFSEFFAQCRRILKPKGACSHQVDLKDHLDRSLNNLRFSEALWESDFFSNSGFYTNRIQLPDMVELVEASGFKVDVESISRWEHLPINKEKLAEPFKSLPNDVLNVSGFIMTCK